MATAPPTKDSIRITKQFTYRGAPKLWSNRYFITAAVAGAQQVAALDAVVAKEAPCFSNSVTIVKGEYIAAGSEIPVTEKTYTTPGTLNAASLFPTPGDAAVVCRYKTTQKTSKNHPIYLYNYYHDARFNTTGGPDLVATEQLTPFNLLASSWVTGLTYGGGLGVLIRCGPHGAVAQDHLVELNIRHRDFT